MDSRTEKTVIHPPPILRQPSLASCSNPVTKKINLLPENGRKILSLPSSCNFRNSRRLQDLCQTCSFSCTLCALHYHQSLLPLQSLAISSKQGPDGFLGGSGQSTDCHIVIVQIQSLLRSIRKICLVSRSR